MKLKELKFWKRICGCFSCNKLKEYCDNLEKYYDMVEENE